MRAYILVQTALGKPGEVVKALRGAEGVKAADVVTGPHDVIAVVEASDVKAIGDLVTEKIHTIEGVERTLTCVVIELG